MSYFGAASGTYSGLGCGPSCECNDCKSTWHGVGEVYEREDEDLGRYGAPATCSDYRIPPVTNFVEFNKARTTCRTVPGGKDPISVISAARKRADEMLAYSIGDLKRARAAVCSGEAPGWPTIGDVTGMWMRDRLGICVDDVSAWTAPSVRSSPDEPPTVAELIRILTNIKNLVASKDILYVCELNGGCEESAWAFVQIPFIQIGKRKACLVQNAKPIVHLCRKFWVPAEKVSDSDQTDLQALTLIHEASHLYYCTDPTDARGSGMGVPECLAQFVAVSNSAPVNKKVLNRCASTMECARKTAARSAAVHGFGAVESQPQMVKVAVSFDPHNLVRLKGRPAVRR